MQWSEQKCLKLIELYKNATILWNPGDPHYYKKSLKENAWGAIGENMDTSAFKCKRKIINLLASFRREKIKIKRSVRTRKGGSQIYESNWFAFEALKFLRHRDKPQIGFTANSTVGEDNEKVGEDADSVLLTEPVRDKTKQDPGLQMLKEAFNILKTAAEQQAPKHLNENTELQSFADFVFQKMKNYSPDAKNVVQQEICRILFKADQGFYDNYSLRLLDTQLCNR